MMKRAEISLRPASPDDASHLLEIYRSYVTDTAVSFETELPSVDAFAERIRHITDFFPWLVCVVDGKIAGYAYASRHRERGAYQWSADLSVYISESYHRCGMASALYTALCDLLRMQGLRTVYAGVTSSNPVSKAFHRRFGFRTVGTYKNVGFKQGKWWDVTWFDLPLAKYDTPPAPPVPFADGTQFPQLACVLKKAAGMIRL